MSALFPSREFSFQVGSHKFTGSFPLPRDQTAMGIALAIRLDNTPFTSLPKQTIFYVEAYIALTQTLETIPELLNDYVSNENTQSFCLEVTENGQTYKARPVTPELSIDMDIEIARQLGHTPLASLSQEAYGIALVAVRLNLLLKDQTDWLENPDTQTALSLYKQCLEKSNTYLNKIKSDEPCQNVAAEINWLNLEDRDYVLQVYNVYIKEYESFQERLKKNHHLLTREAIKYQQPIRSVPAKKPEPINQTDQQAVSRTKARPVQARLVRKS